jgi:hypothetical protein
VISCIICVASQPMLAMHAEYTPPPAADGGGTNDA